jgi:hypothetical protein
MLLLLSVVRLHVLVLNYTIVAMFVATVTPRASPAARISTVARAWQPATTLSELKESKFNRVVVPVEGEGKILVQEMDGPFFMKKLHEC